MEVSDQKSWPVKILDIVPFCHWIVNTLQIYMIYNFTLRKYLPQSWSKVIMSRLLMPITKSRDFPVFHRHLLVTSTPLAACKTSSSLEQTSHSNVSVHYISQPLFSSTTLFKLCLQLHRISPNKRRLKEWQTGVEWFYPNS